MDRASLAAAVESDTRAVVLTHQFGIPRDVDELVDFCRQQSLFVVEDAAAALGARYTGRPVGTFGDAAVISFHFTKIANVGRAGAVLTDDIELTPRIQVLREKSSSPAHRLTDLAKAFAWWVATRRAVYAILRRLWEAIRPEELYEVVEPRPRPRARGFRPCSGFAASLAALQLRRLDANLAKRRQLAAIYASALAGLPRIRTCYVAAQAEPAWMQFPVFVDQKEQCYRYLLRHGVDLSWTFRYSCGASYAVSGMDNAQQAASKLLGLPTYPALSRCEAQRISDLVHEALQQD
jgi:dTDP-4-amino-4,6-dideoxygalactose transaminase